MENMDNMEIAANDVDIATFTDIFNNEDLSDSQPLSFSPSYKNKTLTPSSQPTFITKENKPAKGTGKNGEFRSVQEIDHKYRDVFSYPFFNFIQSKIIDDALYTDKSIVVCAPTGSGKTVVFELAIVQLLMDLEDKGYDGDFKIIYMAPIKALCTERLTEWYPKFTPLGVLCIEVTGDTDVDFSQLKPYKIIITTPEKWDMITRRWKDHRALVEVIKLFLIDEVHILNDEARGHVLEAVVSRMKTVEDSVKAAYRVDQARKIADGKQVTWSKAPRIRFIAVSATVSNPQDVAEWLSSEDDRAIYYKLGDECRPVKLKRVVEGYYCPVGTSIFKFDLSLNYKLWGIIEKYYNGKPALIFCSTRKSVMMTAETLSREMSIRFTDEQHSKLAALASSIKDKKLQALVLCGVGCHHAGLLYEERINIEKAFRDRCLPILVTTTTLAMGVNLPAHLVIIKSTQQYVNGAYQEYSISTILQMIGRAGRPQFDTEATAVIMTRMQDKIADTKFLHASQTDLNENDPDDTESHVDLLESKEYKPRKRKRQVKENEIILNNPNDEINDNHEYDITEDEDLYIDTECEEEATIVVVKSDLEDNENTQYESSSQDNLKKVIDSEDDGSEFEAFAYSIALQLKKLPLPVAEKLKFKMLSMVADEHVQLFLKSD